MMIDIALAVDEAYETMDGMFNKGLLRGSANRVFILGFASSFCTVFLLKALQEPDNIQISEAYLIPLCLSQPRMIAY